MLQNSEKNKKIDNRKFLRGIWRSIWCLLHRYSIKQYSDLQYTIYSRVLRNMCRTLNTITKPTDLCDYPETFIEGITT